MRTVYLDAGRYADAAELHKALRRLFDLPDYYGGNADALYDCLSELREKPRVWLASEGSGDTADAMRKCLRAMEDAGCSVTVLS